MNIGSQVLYVWGNLFSLTVKGLFLRLFPQSSGAPNEDIVQNQLT